MIYGHLPPKLAEISVQQPNLPYNQGNQQFDDRGWNWLTDINYTGKIAHAAEAVLRGARLS
jgi:hypothetical protein